MLDLSPADHNNHRWLSRLWGKVPRRCRWWLHGFFGCFLRELRRPIKCLPEGLTILSF